MTIDYFRYSILCLIETGVRDNVNPKDKTKVSTDGERLPATTEYSVSTSTLDNLVLMVNCKSNEVGKEHNGKGMEERHHGEPHFLTMHGIHLQRNTQNNLLACCI